MPLLYRTHRETHLRDEDELVLLKQASAGVDEYRVGDEVYEIDHSGLDLVRWFRSLNGLSEHYAESLWSDRRAH